MVFAMLRRRFALRSVHLCLVCLLGLTPRPADTVCTGDLPKKVELLIREAPNLTSLNCSLYTPTLKDYQNCPNSTLMCLAGEMKVLIDEWPLQILKNHRARTLNIGIQSLTEHVTRTDSECRQCELLPEEEAEQFLKTLLTILEMVNSELVCS